MTISDEIQKYRQEIKSERMDMSFGEIINMYKDKRNNNISRISKGIQMG